MDEILCNVGALQEVRIATREVLPESVAMIPSGMPGSRFPVDFKVRQVYRYTGVE